MSENAENLLYGSRSLTDEEIALRAALSEWCRVRLAAGARPVTLQAALAISAEAAKHGEAGFFEGAAAEERKPAPLRFYREQRNIWALIPRFGAFSGLSARAQDGAVKITNERGAEITISTAQAIQLGEFLQGVKA